MPTFLWVYYNTVTRRMDRQSIDASFHGADPARYLGTPDGAFSVGFITPISQHFRKTCNRVRLSVDGTLHLHLHLHLGQEDKFEFREQPKKIIRFMSMTGG